MFTTGIDLFRKDWLDVIFFKKNQVYGAYELRKNNSRTTTISLLIASILFVAAFLAPQLINGKPTDEISLKQTEIQLVAPPIDKIVEVVIPKEEAPAPSPVKSKKPTVKFAPPVVKPDALVRNENPPTLKDLVVADPGQQTIEGDINAEVVVTPPITSNEGTGTIGGNGTSGDGIHEAVSLDMMPMPEGGMAGFRKYLSNTIQYPNLALESGIQGTVLVTFVVEKDGSLTDIKVNNKVGGGLDEEAMRVLKKSKKWTPGVQNGQAVRVRYSVPVKFALN